MKELNNHIFSNTTCISKESMLRYINKQLSTKELYEVEKHMLDCELCTDALAGMRYAQNSSMLFAIDNQIDQRVNKLGAKRPIMRNLMVAASLLVVVFGSYFTFNVFDDVITNEVDVAILNEESTTESMEEVLTKANMNIDESETDIKEEIEEKEEIALPFEISIDEVASVMLQNNGLTQEPNVQSFDLVEMEDAEVEEVLEDEIPVLIADEPNEEKLKEEVVANSPSLSIAGNAAATNHAKNDRDVDGLLKNKDSYKIKKAERKEEDRRFNDNRQKKEKAKGFMQSPSLERESVSALKERNDKIVVLNDHKVIDYTEEYQKEYDLNQVVETKSISADFASEEEKNMADKERSELLVEITYKATLEKAIGFYKAKNYTMALEQFSIILKEHPTEVNGQFYGGMSHYYLYQYSNALVELDKVLVNEEAEFNEEANWFKALTLIELKEIAKAKVVLQQIVVTNGFYKTKAEEKLKVL